MDSRIEELAAVIQDHAKAQADLLQQGGWRGKDRYQTYRKCEWLALEILSAIHQYRCDHRDEYQDAREEKQREQLAKQLAGRPRAPFDAADYGAPALNED